MGGVGVIDRFLAVFTQYIDSGFGLLGGEAGFIASTLIVIDVTLASLFWVWGADEDILARLVKKTLFIGVFAYLINNWNTLAKIVFESFSALGLKAAGSSLSQADAGRPLLDAMSNLMGYVSFFENFLQIVILLFAWLTVLMAFFILAIQLFVTLIEFKLTTLAGFILIPFGLFGKTSFAAERVLGNVISSGVKVLVLAIVMGIGSTLFSQFTAGFGAATPTIDDAMSIVLAALSLLGLGIFGPGVANGIVSGGPQLGAGSAIGANLAAGGMVAAGAGLTSIGANALGNASSLAARTGAYATGAGANAYQAGGMAGVASASLSALSKPLAQAGQSLKSNFIAGASGSGSAPASSVNSSSPAGAPDWARRMQRSQLVSQGAQHSLHAVKSASEGGAGSSVNLSEER